MTNLLSASLHKNDAPGQGVGEGTCAISNKQLFLNSAARPSGFMKTGSLSTSKNLPSLKAQHNLANALSLYFLHGLAFISRINNTGDGSTEE